MTALEYAVESYAPRIVLRRTAKRMGIPPEEIDQVFPDHGYADGTDFLQHLRGANEYFRTTRSAAADVSSGSIVRSLGAYSGPRKERRLGSRARDRKQTAPRPTIDPVDDGGAEWPGIADNGLVDDAIASCEEKHTLHGLLGHALIEGINTDETIVEAVNRHLNANVRSGAVGYDVANMRLCYQRLKWNSSAIRRILYGDKSKNRRAAAQAVAIWNLGKSVVGQHGCGEDLALHRNQNPPEIKRTSPEDLIEMGYTLRRITNSWGNEEIKQFFRACSRYSRCPAVIGTYGNVYEWMSYSIFKGLRSPQQVK